MPLQAFLLEWRGVFMALLARFITSTRMAHSHWAASLRELFAEEIFHHPAGPDVVGGKVRLRADEHFTPAPRCRERAVSN